MLDGAADPCVRSRFAARRNGPEPPDALAGRGPVGIHESSNAFVPARHTGDHEIVDDQRRAGGAVVLARVGHLAVPEQMAVRTVQRQNMRVIGDQEHTAAQHRRSAIDAGRGVAGQILAARPAVVPDLTASSRVERVDFIHAGDVDRAVDDDRRHLERARSALNGEQPFRREGADRGGVDLIERAEPVPAQASVIGRPLTGPRAGDFLEGRSRGGRFRGGAARHLTAWRPGGQDGDDDDQYRDPHRAKVYTVGARRRFVSSCASTRERLDCDLSK